jgi:2-C-methyl-D-erythritol 2,4-cyclodiphosphate synthase
VCDALLGAAAAGDMGDHFPSADPRFEGAPSRIFLEHVARLLREKRFKVANVDATVIAQAPMLAPHLKAMREALSGMLGVTEGAVSVKAKSADHLGALGRGEGIAAQAVALIEVDA